VLGSAIVALWAGPTRQVVVVVGITSLTIEAIGYLEDVIGDLMAP
jgi:hypothetical protein